MKLLLENLPAGLQCQRETLSQCLEAMNRALPLQAVYLFGSHARGEARPDSDVDLCIVSDGAERQLEAAQKWREAMWVFGRVPPSRCCRFRRSDWLRSAHVTITFFPPS